MPDKPFTPSALRRNARSRACAAATSSWGHCSGGVMIPPPVEFACDSFSLTSPGVGAEYVLLDPFSGSIEIYDSVLDDARARAASDDDDDDEDDEGGRADRRRRRRRRRRARHDMPPRRTLFSVDDYFGLDLEEYFGARTPFSSHADDDDDRRRGRPRLRRGGEGNDDAIVDWIGLDTCVSVDDFRGTTIVARKTPGAAATSTTPPDSVAALAGRRIRQRSPRSA